MRLVRKDAVEGTILRLIPFEKTARDNNYKLL